MNAAIRLGLSLALDDGWRQDRKYSTPPIFRCDGCHEHESLITAGFLKTTAAATAVRRSARHSWNMLEAPKNRPRRK